MLFLEPHTGLDHCPRILLSCFRARNTCAQAHTQCSKVYYGEIKVALLGAMPKPKLKLKLFGGKEIEKKCNSLESRKMLGMSKTNG